MIDAHEFIATYGPLITIRLREDILARDGDVRLEPYTLGTAELRRCFVPKYRRGNRFDARQFDEQVTDPTVQPLRLGEVLDDPGGWGLARPAMLPAWDSLRPVPIATDTRSGHTLILDSNHTLANLLALDRSERRIECIEIIGEGLESFVEDFRILNRS